MDDGLPGTSVLTTGQAHDIKVAAKLLSNICEG